MVRVILDPYKAPFEFHDCDCVIEEQWETNMRHCGTHYYTNSNCLGMQAKSVWFCMIPFCDNEFDILARKERFLKYYRNFNGKYVYPIAFNDFTTPDGIRQAYSNLDDFSKPLRKGFDWFKLFAGKTRMWLVVDKPLTMKSGSIDNMVDDYTNLSDIKNHDARKCLMEEFKDNNRVRWKGKNDRKNDIKYVHAVKKDNHYYALEKKSKFVDKSECEGMKERIEIPFDDLRLFYPTYNGKILRSDVFIENIDTYQTEAHFYWPKKILETFGIDIAIK